MLDLSALLSALSAFGPWGVVVFVLLLVGNRLDLRVEKTVETFGARMDGLTERVDKLNETMIALISERLRGAPRKPRKRKPAAPSSGK